MTSKKQNKQESNAKKEFLDALRPIGKKTTLTHHLIKKVEKKQTKMPSGKNANTEKFMLGFFVSYGLFKEKKDKDVLLKHGDKLKKYTNYYATQIPETQTEEQEKIVSNTLREIFPKSKK